MTATQTWRLRKQRYALSSECCPACATVQFPPREVCSVCGAPQHLPIVIALPAYVWPADAFVPPVVPGVAPLQRLK